jgi:[ribosomal protein S5]-alanine N-acetyltransferase
MRKFLLGKTIFLRGLREDEITPEGPYFHWLDDLSLDVYTERSYFPNTQERMAAYFRQAQAHQDFLLFGIFDNATEKHIGNITFNQINYINRRAFIAYLLGDHEFTGKGVITDAALMLMYFGFNKLNFERIHGGVSAAHPASQKVCEKVGLLVEGRERRYLLRNGVWQDRLIVGALRDEWMKSHGETARERFDVLPT